MTRYKRRKISAAVKWTSLLMLPVIAVGTAKGMEFLKIKAENKNDTVQCSSVESRKMKKKNGKSDILSGEAILSHGYGIYAEVSDTDVRLQNPMDMVSDNPGDKPYPTEWTAGIDITRTTYGEYSGTTYFNLDNGGQVNNRSSISNDDLLAESRVLPDFTISDTEEPQVLIYHTHTTESFEPFVRDNLDAVFKHLLNP